MPKINLLDKSVYELIAAGEVIERPASVIKELAENSIDAGAHTITVEIKRGGISYIRVADDGCGIAYEDVPNAFVRHATSKVFAKEDLESINTLGFRGEALASVCAVGKVEMVTKRAEDGFGTSYRIMDGEIQEYDRTGCSNGTSIIIRDLFFNIPARLKFLKKDVTEGNYCASVVEKLALSHPSISFRFIRDGKQTLFTGGDGEYYSTVYSVFGKQFAAGLVPVDDIYRDISVAGYVSSPLFTRANRTMQFFFVNGRSVKSPVCCAALEGAFKNSIMTGKFPACVLGINLDPSLFDANISPTKTEVRFSNEKSVFDAVYCAVKNALLGYDESREIKLEPNENSSGEQEKSSTVAIPSASPKSVLEPRAPYSMSMGMSNKYAEQQIMEEAELPLFKKEKKDEEPPLETLPGFAFLTKKSFEKRQDSTEVSSVRQNDSTGNGTFKSNEKQRPDSPVSAVNAMPQRPKDLADTPESAIVQRSEGSVISNISEVPKTDNIEENDAILPESDGRETHERVRVIGELFKTYILCESSGSLILIDKHAAHERINFDRLRRGVDSHGQFLLEPCEVYLSPEEYDAVSRFADKLADVGLLLKFPDNGKVIVEGLPQYFDDANPQEVLGGVAQTLAKGGGSPKAELFDEALHTMACKASIRANENNDISELAWLADKVINDRAIRYCPHGRPVLTQISKRQIEKYFGRIV